MVRESLAHTDVAISESRLSKAAPAVALRLPRTWAIPSGSGVTLRWRASSALAPGSLAGSGSMAPTAPSPALMMRRRDQHCHRPIRSASDWSSCAIRSLLTNSGRAMINCPARQSVLPSASSAATLGSRVSNASACDTKWLAPIGDMFIAADTSAVVRANPVIIAYPGSGSPSSASAMRCDKSVAIVASRWAMSADSCCWLASISVINASGLESSNIFSIVDRSADKDSGYPQPVLIHMDGRCGAVSGCLDRESSQLDEHRDVIAGCLAFAFLAHDLGVGDAVAEGR